MTGQSRRFIGARNPRRSHHNRRAGRRLLVGQAPSFRYLDLPGTSGNYVSAPDAAALDITGDLDVSVRFVAGSIDTSVTLKGIFGKWAWPQYSWLLRLHSGGAGLLEFLWSTDGTTANSLSSGEIIPAAATGVRATLDVDDGAGGHVPAVYYTTSPPLAAPVWTPWASETRAGATSVFSSSSELRIGSDPDDPARTLTAQLVHATYRSGMDGTVVADFDPSRFASLAATSYTDPIGTAAVTWTINQSGSPSAQLVEG